MESAQSSSGDSGGSLTASGVAASEPSVALVGSQESRPTVTGPSSDEGGRAASQAPAPAGPDSPAVTAPEAQVPGMLAAWSRSWSEQDVEGYLSFYSSGFQPPEGSSREAWAATRRARILKPTRIEVSLDQIEIRKVGADRAAASFVQSYASDLFSDVAVKTLDLVWEEERWKILRERSGTGTGAKPSD